jgi:F-type H+-transporting ATPase subunit alpha
MSVPEQIIILLALTAELFDGVALDQMTEAEHAVREAAAKIPDEVTARFDVADKLSDDDRATIMQIARQALFGFLPKTAQPKTGFGPKVSPRGLA